MGRLDYLKQYGSSNAVRTHESALKNFFELIYDQREGLDELADRYFRESRNYEKDIQNFKVSLKDRPPKTINLKLTAIRMFLLENKVELPQLFWRRLRGRNKGSRAVTMDKVPSNDELRKIIMHLPVQGKALYLTLSSSGMRLGEALQLKLEDLELDMSPAKINIRGEYTRTGSPRTAFVSRETRENLEEWLKFRDRYLKRAAGRSAKNPKSATDTRLFPFKATSAYVMWRNALNKTGNRERGTRTNRSLMRPSVLRKFFRSKMAALIPIYVTEALMGYEQYLAEVYQHYSVQDLAQFYKRGENALLVFREAGEVQKLFGEIKNIKELNKQFQTIINGLTAETLSLRSKVERQEAEFTRLKKVAAEIAELKKAMENLLCDGGTQET